MKKCLRLQSTRGTGSIRAGGAGVDWHFLSNSNFRNKVAENSYHICKNNLIFNESRSVHFWRPEILWTRYEMQHYSSDRFALRKSRGHIGNYLGMTIDAINRLAAHFKLRNYLRPEVVSASALLPIFPSINALKIILNWIFFALK